MLIFMTVFLLNSIPEGCCQGKKAILEKIIVKYENFTTLTSESVTCEFFEDTFRESIKEIRIDDANEMKLLSPKVGDVISLGDKKSIDVRVKVTLYYKSYKLNYCIDRFGVFVDSSGKYFHNKYLHDFIIKHIPGEGW
jgi:hypothetical protein